MRSGFTLIELAIVLVILGLLAGGIMEGQSLIRQAEIRSVIADEKRYAAAVQTFRDKYFALPGDMTNATDFWGSAGGTGSDTTCENLATSTATCNGDGNGQVDAANGNSVHEIFLAWQQLANAGLIEGRYCGAGASHCSGTGVVDPGVNVAPSRIATNALWWVLYEADAAGTSSFFAYSNYGNILSLTYLTAGGATLTPAEAWNIDKKLDDGLPGSGGVISMKGDGSTTFCTTAAGVAPPGDTGATYNLSDTNKDCGTLLFVRAF